MAPILSKGFYRHYKGRYYEVLDLVRHSESEEWHVLYRTCYGDFSLWVRPFDMFTGTVLIDGVGQQRFAYVGNQHPEGVVASN
ncbi:DUF1653 domain-containing protein [Perlucidibaca aquatica]|uniref:DUF1653 domain-containing protein n=1 Tax=Perlucidibaca aquatica TaxID=1852776 RepID=UPI00083A64A7|nr:DUF1653 domain-containing protein [Perlucidibaca aquatica]